MDTSPAPPNSQTVTVNLPPASAAKATVYPKTTTSFHLPPLHPLRECKLEISISMATKLLGTSISSHYSHSPFTETSSCIIKSTTARVSAHKKIQTNHHLLIWRTSCRSEQAASSTNSQSHTKRPLTAADLPESARERAGIRVAYQGVSGAYSESAAEKAYPNCETVPCEQFDIAF